jgi:hypothetical protein
MMVVACVNGHDTTVPEIDQILRLLGHSVYIASFLICPRRSAPLNPHMRTNNCSIFSAIDRRTQQMEIRYTVLQAIKHGAPLCVSSEIFRTYYVRTLSFVLLFGSSLCRGPQRGNGMDILAKELCVHITKVIKASLRINTTLGCHHFS